MSRNPFVTVLMVVFGIILLLPGICAIIFTSGMRADPSMLIILVPCLGVSVLGVLLLIKAFR